VVRADDITRRLLRSVEHANEAGRAATGTDPAATRSRWQTRHGKRHEQTLQQHGVAVKMPSLVVAAHGAAPCGEAT